MDMNDVLDFLGDDAKKKIFEHNLEKLSFSESINLDALRICIRTLPQIQQSKESLDERLWDLLESRIPGEANPEYLFDIARVCLINPVAATELHQRIFDHLRKLLDAIVCKAEISDEFHADTQRVVGFLHFVKCSYWIPHHNYHLISTDTVALLSECIGLEVLENAAVDALSSLFSLYKRGGKLNRAPPSNRLQDIAVNTSVDKSIVDVSIFERLRRLPEGYITSTSSRIFGVWFQWVSQAAIDNVELPCVYHADYWNLIRLGLLIGYGDQRKYCLGIIEQSLHVAQKDITTPSMIYRNDQAHLLAYKNYASLFEMIVLNRYAGQIEASLPDLTALLGEDSKITSTMATTLLAAAMNSKVQEGIRKLIGNWYIKYVLEVPQDLTAHTDFFLGPFLDWATDGSLFNATLFENRRETLCRHGEALVAVVAQFVSNHDIPSEPVNPNNASSESANRSIQRNILGVIRYISNTGGKIFQPAILYLLEGLLRGLLSSPATSYVHILASTELTEIISLSRLAGLPEISSDLLSWYCKRLCEMTQPDIELMDLPGYARLHARAMKLVEAVDQDDASEILGVIELDISPLGSFMKELHDTKHASIQGNLYAPACKRLIGFLDRAASETISHVELYDILQALWDEAERREFNRPVAMYLPLVMFHPTCIQTCIQHCPASVGTEPDLTVLLSKALLRLQRLSHGRSYVLSVLIKSVRAAVQACPQIVGVLPIDEFILDYLNHPPSIKPEFLFEVIAAQKLTLSMPHRTYASYYGIREWHAYAALIDLLNRFPGDQLDVAKSVLDRLLRPWVEQKPPIIIKSPWKDTFQLQGMLLLSDWCIAEEEADAYIERFMHALTIEPWPRYRFLLEWVLVRLYIRFPGRTTRILEDLERLDVYTPIHIASLMKLGLLVSPWESEAFAVSLATQLTCFSASPKVQMRHEANYVFPLLFELAATKGWKSIIENPASAALNSFIRGLDKFKATPWTIRTLRLDPVKDFTLVNILQGQYLTIESPEKEFVAYEDFVALQQEVEVGSNSVSSSRVSIGDALSEGTFVAQVVKPAPNTPMHNAVSVVPSAFLQTKAGFDLDALHPASGPPSQQIRRPASVILIASLIDNPTNLGGLSRISESFGLEALYIDDLKKTAHKDFKATSVTSEKHFPIHQLKVAGVPQFLLEAKTKGYEVVGIEQTDRSGILGEERTKGEENEITQLNRKSLGTLPKKCVLVLGSEKEGIAAEVLAVLDRAVEIKTVGVTRSLNVQTAGGIAVYEWWREWGARV